MTKHIHIHLPARRAGKTKDATYNLRERDGTDWGLWTASSPAEAKELLKKDIKAHPNKYLGIKYVRPGEPDVSQVRAILTKDAVHPTLKRGEKARWNGRIVKYVEPDPLSHHDVRVDIGGGYIKSVPADQVKPYETKDSFPTKFAIRGRNYISAGKLRNNGQQACYEELDAKGQRTGRMIWLTTTGQVVADEKPTKDAENKFVTKVDIRLPNDPAFGNRAGKVMNRGTVVYKTGPLYRPWWSKESNGVLRLNPSDVQEERTTDTRDSEENDAFIQGYKDAMKGKQPDAAFHPGGEKKPAVTAQYAKGHKQGTADLAKKNAKDGDPTGTVGVRG